MQQNNEERFTITDDKKASWALNKIKTLRKQSARFAISCDSSIADLKEQIADIEEKKQHDKTTCDNECSYFEMLLMEYYDSIPRDDKKPNKAKTAWTYKLPEGKLVRKPQVMYDHDDEKLLESLQDNGLLELIKSESKPKWGEIRKLLNDDGELIVDGGVFRLNGIRVEKLDDKFVVEV